VVLLPHVARRSGPKENAIFSLVASLAAWVLGSAAQAGVISVYPGPSAIQTAIAAASPGDTLRVHPGTYPEHVVINKPLRILGAGPSRVVIDAGCSAMYALEVMANGVSIRRVKVVGGSFDAIDIRLRADVTVSRTVVEGSFDVPHCGAEQYGINVSGGTGIIVTSNVATGFYDAGIYVGGVPSSSAVLVAHNQATHNNTEGITVENSGPGEIVVHGNRVLGNGPGGYAGIRVGGSESIVVTRNVVEDSGDVGLRLEQSEGCLITRNVVSGHVADIADDGVTNCWQQNKFTTGSVTSSCPP